MTREWMYCFRCGMSHYHTQQADGRWKCPNCEATRPTPIMPIVEPEPDNAATDSTNDGTDTGADVMADGRRPFPGCGERIDGR
jgi:hypothetical protein